MQVSKLPINSAEMSQVHPLLLSVAQNCRKCVQNKQIKNPHTNESQPFVMSYYGGALMQKAVFKRPSTVSLVGLIMQGCSTWVRVGKYRPGNGLIWDLGQAARPGSTGDTGDIIHQPVKRIRIKTRGKWKWKTEEHHCGSLVSLQEQSLLCTVMLREAAHRPLRPSSSSSAFLQSRRPSPTPPVPLPHPPTPSHTFPPQLTLTHPLQKSQGCSSVGVLRLLLHVVQLLDQGRERDPLLGRLLPAPAHQLVHLFHRTPHQVKKAASGAARKISMFFWLPLTLCY